MITQTDAHTQVSPETELTSLLKLAHPDYWASGERQGKSADEISRAILRMLCGVETDDEVSDRHPEVRALFAQLERERVKIADLRGGEKS